VPQREPLSAPLLGALAILAGLVGGWLALGVGALAQGGAGALAGLPWHGIRFLPTWLPRADLSLDGAHGAGTVAAVLLAGPLAALVVGFAVHALAQVLGAPPALRVLAYEVFVASWLQVPLLMLAAGFPRAGGPFSALYERLGEPESGRWAVVVLGGLAVWGIARVVGEQAVAVGGGWLRVDGREFRRRVALLFAACPFAAAVAVATFERAFGPPLWPLAGAVLVVTAVWLRTP
jgi:hypothetical protein